jgi:hypothetical protein
MSAVRTNLVSTLNTPSLVWGQAYSSSTVGGQKKRQREGKNPSPIAREICKVLQISSIVFVLSTHRFFAMAIFVAEALSFGLPPNRPRARAAHAQLSITWRRIANSPM